MTLAPILEQMFIRRMIYAKIPHNAPVYFITISFPFEFRTYDLGVAVSRARYLMSKFEKHLLHCDRRWTDKPYDFDLFFENVKDSKEWHIHLLATFMNPTTGAQLSEDFITDCMSKACAQFMSHYNLSRAIDSDVKLVPYNDVQKVIEYCTKELSYDDSLHTDRMYCPQTLFNLPSNTYKKGKNRGKYNKIQRKIRRARTKDDLSQVLSQKYVIERL